MKDTGEEMLIRANSALSSYNQNILIIRWTGKEIEFNNGIVLKNNERSKFIKRVFNKKTDLWKKNHDEILTNPKIISQIKSSLAELGGVECQRIHGEKIKLNLNTGTAWNKGKKGLQTAWNKGLSKDTDERLETISKNRTGEGNPCYGREFTLEEKKIKSVQMKKLILEGKFTPNSNNRNTHWDSYYLGKKYRSSWEAWYHYLSSDSEFETLRIQYEINGETKIYIVDFVDHLNRTVAEVKPIKMTNTETFCAKWNALISWADSNGYETRLVTAEWLVEHTKTIDYSLFDERTSTKIKKIYETNKKDRN